MSGRVIVVQASSSEDESMASPAAGGGDGITELAGDATRRGNETMVNSENKTYHRYDREDMLNLYNHPFAKIRPSILSPDFDMVVENGDGGTGDSAQNKLWSPELWIQSIWNPEPRQHNSAMSGSANHGWSGRRQGDHDGHGQPMSKKKQIDRLKTENEDGIVLSPQRRSFGAGCQVATSSAVASANAVGSQIGGVSSTTQNRRSTSPVNAGGDDRSQQVASQHPNARSSFRARGAISVIGPVPQQPSQVQNVTAVTGGGYGRGDRVENWRDRSDRYSSSGFGRGREAPGSINTYGRQSRGGMNSWQGGGRRSYDRGGYSHGEETLPEWVTEGPSDMYETMELRGFDEEERQEMQMEQSNAQKRGSGPARVQQYRSSTSGIEGNAEKENSTRRSMERGEQFKRDNKSPGAQPPSRKPVADGEKYTGKMPAEALVDGFDIGDMAQFLSAAGADFDSITNGEATAHGKTSSMANVIQVPATPTAASRFSKFFSHAGGQNAGNARAASEDKQSQPAAQRGQQQQSVNVMELLSKAAVAGNANRGGAGGLVGGTNSLPVGAKSLDEIEAAYKANSSNQKSEHERSSNKVLQELFQSARSVNAPPSGTHEARVNSEPQRQGDQKTIGNMQGNNQLPEQANQQALELLQKGSQNGGTIATKGNPLADPAQQQHLLDALRKLHIQQQQMPPQQHPDAASRHPNSVGVNDGANPFLAAYPQLAGLQHLLQQQQQAMQMGNLQAAMNNTGRVPSPLGMVGMAPQQAAGSSASVNPAFAGFLPPANVPPPPITQQDLLLAHSQSVYQRAMMNRKIQGIEEQLPPPKPSIQQNISSGGGKLPTAFLPTSVIKQMHGGVKSSKENSGEDMQGARPIVKQQLMFPGQSQEQVSPNSASDQLLRNLQQQNANKSAMSGPAGNAMGAQQPMAPPPSLTPQDLQRLIDQTQRQQRQHQERVLLEQYAKSQQQQQQMGSNPGGAMNPAAVSAALALQNNPMFVQMLRAQAMQAQQMALLQQQAAASGLSQASLQQPIPATATVSAIPNAAQLVRARLAPPPPSAPAGASNPELMRQFLQQQHQQMFLNQLRQQAPADANLLLNRLLTGQTAQQQMHQMPGVQPQSTSLGGLHFPSQGMPDAKPMTVEELERLHKQTAAMQQPQS